MAQAEGFIRFDPERIAETAARLEQKHKLFLQHIESIGKKSKGLKQCWQGASADSYGKQMEALEKQAQVLGQVMQQFGQDLHQASGVYRSGEASATQAAEGLPTDGIFVV